METKLSLEDTSQNWIHFHFRSGSLWVVESGDKPGFAQGGAMTEDVPASKPKV